MVKKITLGPGPGRWPISGSGLDEITANYVMQYMTPAQRIRFVNDAHKVLKKCGKLIIIVPHWCASKYYQDAQVAWPPVSESWFSMLNKAVRENQPFKVKGYTCDFDYGIGYGMHPAIVSRNQEYQQHALGFFREACQDIHVTLTKR